MLVEDMVLHLQQLEGMDMEGQLRELRFVHLHPVKALQLRERSLSRRRWSM
tara:strand:+ start:162 stop:314 length:153 start_codon:yes stop_codon:yes gene_type:complete